MNRLARTTIIIAIPWSAAFQTAHADLEEWTMPSIEWLVDASDAIVIGEIVRDKARAPMREYRVVEIVKPHDRIRPGVIVKAKYTRSKRADRVMVFLKLQADSLVPFYVISLEHPDQLAYYFYFLCHETEPIDYLAIDKWGVLIETPAELIRRIKQRMQQPSELPPDHDPEAVLSGTAKPVCSRYPRGWEYDSGSHDVCIYIIVPPGEFPDNTKQDALVPRKATPREREAIQAARLLHREGILEFTHAMPDDPLVGGEYQVSPDGKYLLNGADHKILLYDMKAETLLLARSGQHTAAGFSPAGRYLVWQSYDVGFFVYDLARRKVALRVLDDEWQYEFARYYDGRTFSPDDRVLAVMRSEFSSDVVAKVWDLESGRLLLSWSGRVYRFSPKATYFLSWEPPSGYLVETATGKRIRKMPEGIDTLVFSANEQITARIDPGGKKIVIEDLVTGKLIKEITLFAQVERLEFLDDNESLVAYMRSGGDRSTELSEVLIFSAKPGNDERRTVKHRSRGAD